MNRKMEKKTKKTDTAKGKNVKRLVNQLFSVRNLSIRFLAKVIGSTASVFPAVKYAPLY